MERILQRLMCLVLVSDCLFMPCACLWLWEYMFLSCSFSFVCWGRGW